MKVYDLSLPFSLGDMVFPGTPAMSYKHTHTIENDNYNLGLASINTHAGTHTDAPLHFVADGKSLGEVDINRYVGPIVIVDCSQKGAFDTIDVNDVRKYEQEIIEAKRVAFYTNWSKRANTSEFYTDYPVLTLDLANYLVSLGVVMIGVEPPSLNPPLYIEVHKAFLENNVAIVEGLTNLNTIINKKVIFCGAPIAFKEADGFPIRAYAIEL